MAQASTEGGGGSVLVVDDESEVVAMLEAALAREGTRPYGSRWRYRARTARNGSFDAILCDIRMPGLDGHGLARGLATIRPDLVNRLLLMTGDVLRTRGLCLQSFMADCWKSRSTRGRSAAGFWS